MCVCGGVKYLHLFHEGREVVGRPARVLHHLHVVDIRSSAVPVHHDDVAVGPGQQQLRDLLQPRRRRSGGPVPVDDEGGRPGPVHVGVRVGRVAVGQQRAAGAIVPGVEQQPDLEAGSHDGVSEI